MGPISRTLLLIVLSAAALGPMACTSLVLPAVPDAPSPVAAPALAPITFGATGEPFDAEEVRTLLETHVYGAPPPAIAPRLIARRVVATGAFDGRATIEELDLEIGAGHGDGVMTVALALPTPSLSASSAPSASPSASSASRPSPVILLQTFCGNRAAFRGMDAVAPPRAPYPSSCDGGVLGPLVRFALGKHIAAPPFEQILDRGYALAYFYPGDIVPDSQELGPPALANLTQTLGGKDLGAVGAWAWLYSRVIDVLEDDPRLDRDRMAVWGHSRNGKSALVAGALDPRIDAVIAHQSGTGGATLTTSLNGESVAQITEAYPHWFTPAYAELADNEAAAPVDQHQLIALTAPRPILFGNARRDQWSDPQGAFLAAQAADPAYEAAGVRGLDQSAMSDTNLSAELAFFIRPGRHGVTARDWALFLDFLDAHAAPASRAP